jgi:four helix bundle protein
MKGRRQKAETARAVLPPFKTLDFSSGTTSASSRTTMNQWREDMKRRTHTFAVDVVRLVQEIPDRSDTRRLKDQLVGAASGADLNWHAACRGRTHKEFTSKLGVVLEEADEAAECLDIIRDTGIAEGDEMARLCAPALPPCCRAFYCPAFCPSTLSGSALIGSSFSRSSSWLTGGIFAFTPVSSFPSSSSRPFDKVRNTE